MPKPLDWVLNHHKYPRPSWKEATKINVEQEQLMTEKMQHNKKMLNIIFQEIVSVCDALKVTQDVNSRKALNSRYEYLTHKYCHSNAIDEKINFS